MGTKSVSELILECVQQTGKPIRYTDIRAYMKKSNKNYTEGTLRTVLSSLVRDQIVTKVKFPTRTSFYGNPDWFDEQGRVKPELNFNPYFNK